MSDARGRIFRIVPVVGPEGVRYGVDEGKTILFGRTRWEPITHLVSFAPPFPGEREKRFQSPTEAATWIREQYGKTARIRGWRPS